MEGKVATSRFTSFAAMVLATLALVCTIFMHDLQAQNAEDESGQISLQRAVTAREYEGKSVEGQEWVVSPGDSLWRILIQEKGFSEKRFSQYVNLIRRLNPRMKTADVLRIGDRVFIPLRPDETLAFQPGASKRDAAEALTASQGATTDYTVKPGDHLLRVLRDRLGVSDERTLNLYYNLTKDLNPQKKNWDLIQAGETIRLPVVGEAREVRVQATGPKSQERAAPATDTQPTPVSLAESKPVLEKTPMPAPSMALDYPRQLAARENFVLLGQVIETVGNEIQSDGQEQVALREGSIRIDRHSFPIVYNRKIDQRVMLDVDDRIPDSLRTQLNEKTNGTSVMTMSKNTSVQEAVSQLLARLGFQPLPAEQAVTLQEGGVAFEAKGQWVVMAPEESNKPQQVYVVNVTDKAGQVPEYLKSHLALKGLHLREVIWPPSPTEGAMTAQDPPGEGMQQAKTLPRDKREIVDALLRSYGIPYDVRVALSWELGEGLMVETRCDRVFEWRGQQTALFFQRVGSDMKKYLQKKQGIRIVELDLASLSSRELIGKLLSELGDSAAYREHRFSAADGMLKDRLVVSASGFLLPKRSTFVTDREIPEDFQRFFFEKGLEIVYFQ